jgi:hypothetical protein
MTGEMEDGKGLWRRWKDVNSEPLSYSHFLRGLSLNTGSRVMVCQLNGATAYPPVAKYHDELTFPSTFDLTDQLAIVAINKVENRG